MREGNHTYHPSRSAAIGHDVQWHLLKGTVARPQNCEGRRELVETRWAQDHKAMVNHTVLVCTMVPVYILGRPQLLPDTAGNLPLTLQHCTVCVSRVAPDILAYLVLQGCVQGV